MTTSYTLFSDISSLVNDILEASVDTLTQRNLLVATSTIFRDTAGMNPRKLNRWGTVTMRSLAEAEEITPENVSKAAVTTLTPARFGNAVFLSDERLTTDWENVLDETRMLLGDSAARHIDQNMGSAIPSITGGTVTVGSGLGTASWSNIMAAYAMAQQKNIPGPYFCTVGAGQWYHLINNGGTTISSTFMRSEMFQDRIINNYYVTSLFGDVTFVVTNGVRNASGGTCYGGLYNRQALAYDERTPFTLEPERKASRSGWLLNVNFRYASGVYDPLQGIQIISTDVIPTT